MITLIGWTDPDVFPGSAYREYGLMSIGVGSKPNNTVYRLFIRSYEFNWQRASDNSDCDYETDDKGLLMIQIRSDRKLLCR